MPDILHRISIDAPRKRVHDLIAGTDGIARWWSGCPLGGEHTVGGRFQVYFGAARQPAAVIEVVADAPDQVDWRVVAGPDTWIGTRIRSPCDPPATTAPRFCSRTPAGASPASSWPVAAPTGAPT